MANIRYKEITYYYNIMHKSRKLTEEDLFGHSVSKNQLTHIPVNDIQKYNNVEYGAKKRIKP